MAIKTSDLQYIESIVGYGAKASVYMTERGLCIEVGKNYEGIGWFGGRLHLSSHEVDAIDNDKHDIVQFAEEASKRFNDKLAGKYLR